MAERAEQLVNVVAPQVWQSLHKWLPRRSPDSDYWWDLTGLHLAILLEASGYATEKQYDALLFHYHWIVHYMGPRPDKDGVLTRKSSVLGIEGLPIEYSWKWNTSTSNPDVRYTVESYDQYSGTSSDPLKQRATLEMLHRIAEVESSMDLTLVHHFLATLFDHDHAKYNKEANAGASINTTFVSAVEFLAKGVNLKSYFLPRKLGQKDNNAPMDVYEESLKQLDPENKAREAMNNFLQTSKEGKSLSPFMLAVDDIDPEKSRVKLYFQTSRTSFNSVREIMTLGGLNSISGEHFKNLKAVMAAVMDLPNDFAEDKDTPLTKFYDVELPDELNGYLYYFDIALGAEIPEVKFYLPIRWYGPDDLKVAKGLTRWMTENGRGEYCQRYLDVLQTFSGSRPVESGKGMQIYLSFIFKTTGELDITSYVGPAPFDASRMKEHSN